MIGINIDCICRGYCRSYDGPENSILLRTILSSFLLFIGSNAEERDSSS